MNVYAPRQASLSSISWLPDRPGKGGSQRAPEQGNRRLFELQGSQRAGSAEIVELIKHDGRCQLHEAAVQPGCLALLEEA
jgi:hypothetical protein